MIFPHDSTLMDSTPTDSLKCEGRENGKDDSHWMEK